MLPSQSSDEAEEGSADGLPPLTPEDLRWRADPLRTEEWVQWFETQLKLSTKVIENGLKP